MLAFTVLDTKRFMSLLLKGDAFDDFHLRQAEISSFSHISIDGKRDPDYYEGEETEKWCSWAEMKHILFEIIRGKKKPKSMKLVLSRSSEEAGTYPNSSALFWNLLFRENTLLCTLSIAQTVFSLDKTDESTWENWVFDFCQKHEIAIQKENH